MLRDVTSSCHDDHTSWLFGPSSVPRSLGQESSQVEPQLPFHVSFWLGHSLPNISATKHMVDVTISSGTVPSVYHHCGYMMILQKDVSARKLPNAYYC